MFAKQRVLGSTVIELGFKPLGRLMARAALGAHDFVVGLILKVTIDTLGRRFPMLQIWRMTIGTLCIGMCALKVKVGKAVIKGILIQNNNDRVATFVFGVARRTLIILYFCTKSMKPFLLLDISCHIFMTIKAEIALPFFVEQLVT
jgi:hypothetical protein